MADAAAVGGEGVEGPHRPVAVQVDVVGQHRHGHRSAPEHGGQVVPGHQVVVDGPDGEGGHAGRGAEGGAAAAGGDGHAGGAAVPAGAVPGAEGQLRLAVEVRLRLEADPGVGVQQRRLGLGDRAEGGPGAPAVEGEGPGSVPGLQIGDGHAPAGGGIGIAHRAVEQIPDPGAGVGGVVLVDGRQGEAAAVVENRGIVDRRGDDAGGGVGKQAVAVVDGHREGGGLGGARRHAVVGGFEDQLPQRRLRLGGSAGKAVVPTALVGEAARRQGGGAERPLGRVVQGDGDRVHLVHIRVGDGEGAERGDAGGIGDRLPGHRAGEGGVVIDRADARAHLGLADAAEAILDANREHGGFGEPGRDDVFGRIEQQLPERRLGHHVHAVEGIGAVARVGKSGGGQGTGGHGAHGGVAKLHGHQERLAGPVGVADGDRGEGIQGTGIQDRADGGRRRQVRRIVDRGGGDRAARRHQDFGLVVDAHAEGGGLAAAQVGTVVGGVERQLPDGGFGGGGGADKAVDPAAQVGETAVGQGGGGEGPLGPLIQHHVHGVGLRGVGVGDVKVPERPDDRQIRGDLSRIGAAQDRAVVDRGQLHPHHGGGGGKADAVPRRVVEGGHAVPVGVRGQGQQGDVAAGDHGPGGDGGTVQGQHGVTRQGVDTDRLEAVSDVGIGKGGLEIGGGKGQEQILGAHPGHVRHQRQIVGVDHLDGKITGDRRPHLIGGGNPDLERANVGVGRCAAEGGGGGVEGEPDRQGGAVGAAGGQHQGVPGVGVGKGVAGQGEGEGGVLVGGLRRHRRLEHRGHVGTAHRQREGVGHRRAQPVAGGHGQRDRAHVGAGGGAAEGGGGGVEGEPAGQGRTVGQGGAEAERIPGIHIGEGVSGQGHGERRIPQGRHVAASGIDGRRVVDPGDRQGHGGGVHGAVLIGHRIGKPVEHLAAGGNPLHGRAGIVGERAAGAIPGQGAVQAAGVDGLDGEHRADVRVAVVGQQVGGGETPGDILVDAHHVAAGHGDVVDVDRRELKRIEDVAAAVVAGIDADIENALVRIRRGAAEGPAAGVEGEPGGQGRAVGQGRVEGEEVRIDAGEQVIRHGEAEPGILDGHAVADGLVHRQPLDLVQALLEVVAGGGDIDQRRVRGDLVQQGDQVGVGGEGVARHIEANLQPRRGGDRSGGDFDAVAGVVVGVQGLEQTDHVGDRRIGHRRGPRGEADRGEDRVAGGGAEGDVADGEGDRLPGQEVKAAVGAGGAGLGGGLIVDPRDGAVDEDAGPGHGQVEGVGDGHAAAVGGGHGDRVDGAVALGLTAEGAGGGVEDQPIRERRAIGQGGGQGQGVARVLIGEGGGGQGDRDRIAGPDVAVFQGLRQGGGVVGVGHMDGEGEGGGGTAQVGGGQAHGELSDIAVIRGAVEAAAGGVEGEPRRQGRAVVQGGAVGEPVTGVHLREGGLRQLEAQPDPILGEPVGEGVGHRRRVVDVVDGEIEGGGGDPPVAVIGGHPHRERPDIAVVRGAGKGAAGGVEGQPVRQGRAVGQGGGQDRGIFGIGEGSGGQLERKRLVLAGGLVGGGNGDLGRGVETQHLQGETVGGLRQAVGGADPHLHKADIGVVRGAGKGAGGGIEGEPGRQGRAIGPGGREAQERPGIGVGKAALRHGERKRRPLDGLQVRQGDLQNRAVVGDDDFQLEGVRHVAAVSIGGGHPDIEQAGVGLGGGTGKGPGEPIEVEPAGQPGAVGQPGGIGQ